MFNQSLIILSFLHFSLSSSLILAWYPACCLSGKQASEWSNKHSLAEGSTNMARARRQHTDTCSSGDRCMLLRQRCTRVFPRNISTVCACPRLKGTLYTEHCKYLQQCKNHSHMSCKRVCFELSPNSLPLQLFQNGFILKAFMSKRGKPISFRFCHISVNF